MTENTEATEGTVASAALAQPASSKADGPKKPGPKAGVKKSAPSEAKGAANLPPPPAAAPDDERKGPNPPVARAEDPMVFPLQAVQFETAVMIGTDMPSSLHEANMRRNKNTAPTVAHYVEGLVVLERGADTTLVPMSNVRYIVVRGSMPAVLRAKIAAMYGMGE